jgi:hypothetical protein
MPAAALTLTDGISPVQTPHTAPPQSLNSPSVAKISSAARAVRGADCSALRRTIFFLGGGAPKKAASKNEKYKNTQLAAAVPELEGG